MVLIWNLETILAILSAIPISSFRALLSCGFVCCILLGGFTFNEVVIKSSDIVLVHAFLSVSSLPRNYYQFFRPH